MGGMTGADILQVFGLIVVGALSFYAAVLKSTPTAPEGRSASAAEVESLGKRLDAETARGDLQDRKIRALYEYIAQDHAEHRKHGWEVRPLPEEIA